MYFQRDGQWKIVHTHWSFIKHKLPENLEVPLPVQMSQQEYPGVLSEIMALESAAMERWRKGDPGGFIELYTPQATYFDTGTPQRLGGEDLRAELARRKGLVHYEMMEFISPSIQVQRDMAVLFYRFFSTRLNRSLRPQRRPMAHSPQPLVLYHGRAGVMWGPKSPAFGHSNVRRRWTPITGFSSILATFV